MIICSHWSLIVDDQDMLIGIKHLKTRHHVTKLDMSFHISIYHLH